MEILTQEDIFDFEKRCKNTHLALIENFYIKNKISELVVKKEKKTKKSEKDLNKSDLSSTDSSKSTDSKIDLTSLTKPIKKSKISEGTQIIFNWNYHSEDKEDTIDTFIIPDIENDVKLSNHSFIHSILYAIDTMYYASNTQQKLKDCKDIVEILRKNLYQKEKVSKEDTEIIRNLENNVYSKDTIQYIVNYFNSFHLLVIGSSDKPVLYPNGNTKKTKNTYKSAPSIILVYLDNVSDIYKPIEYNLDNRETFYVSWREKEFLELLKKVYLYNQPKETKKWLVADLRNWISFFCVDIDITMDKKSILEKFRF